jgi:hypothetical protein
MKKKINLYLRHVLHLFLYFSICLAVSIIFDIYNSETSKIEIEPNYLLRNSILPFLLWLYHTISGRLTKRINSDYESEEKTTANII